MSGKRLLLLLLASLSLLASLLFHSRRWEAWRLWNIPIMTPAFADTRNVLGAIESARLGYDPLYQNPRDPFGLVMVYPRLWLALGQVGLGLNDTILLAILQILLFIAGLFLFVDQYDRRTALWITLAVISPATMLSFERGNTDLLVFFLLACALAFDLRARLAAVSLLELAALLKIYPVFGLGYLLKMEKKSFVLWAGAGIGLFCVYVLLVWRDLRQILAYSPKGVVFNFGADVLGLWLEEMTGLRWVYNLTTFLLYLLVYGLIFLMLYRSDRDGPVSSVIHPRLLDAFRLGALIYIGSFIQGNVWNYRMIMLIFAIPQLAVWASEPSMPGSRIAAVTTAVLLLSCWGMEFPVLLARFGAVGNGLSLVLDEAANWSLLAGLTYLFFASLPGWIREEIRRFFEKYTRRPAAINP